MQSQRCVDNTEIGEKYNTIRKKSAVEPEATSFFSADINKFYLSS